VNLKRAAVGHSSGLHLGDQLIVALLQGLRLEKPTTEVAVHADPFEDRSNEHVVLDVLT
jgi:hypothetical protein